MATAYKYVERKAEDNINWAEVGSNVNNMLNEEMRVRTEKKSAIDEATREYQKVLNTVPQGENSELNKFALGFSDDLQKQMLMQETLLKSGQLSPSQYTMMRQNLTDGTDQGFSLLQDYNNEYEAKMSLLGDDVAYGDQLSQIDLEIMANVEGFSNFSNSKLVINPESGLVSMGKMIVNPEDPEGPRILDPNRNNLVSVQNLKNRIKTKITKYDVVGNAEKYSATLGTDVRETVESMGTAYRAGILKEITDIRNKDGGYKDMSEAQIAELAKKMNVLPSDISAVSLWQKSSRDWAQSQLQGGSYNAASTLMDFSKFTPDGLQYTTTFDESETLDENGNRKENVILLKSENGRTVTKMTESQNTVAEEALVAQLNIQLDYKENVTPEKMNTPYRPTASETNNSNNKKKELSQIGNVAQLWYGNAQEVDEAQKGLRVLNPNIKSTERTKDAIIVTYMDGTVEPLSFYAKTKEGETPIPLSQEQWVTANANYLLGDKIKDIPTLIKNASIDNTKKLSTILSLDKAGETPEKVTDLERVINYIETPDFLDSNFFENMNNKDAVPLIMKAIGSFGASLESQGNWDNTFKIKAADGTIKEFNTNESTTTAAEAQRDAIVQFMTNHMTDKAAANLVKSGRIKSGNASQY